jgi:hypothetical protein
MKEKFLGLNMVMGAALAIFIIGLSSYADNARNLHGNILITSTAME